MVPVIPVCVGWCRSYARVKSMCVGVKLAWAIAFHSPLPASLEFRLSWIPITPITEAWIKAIIAVTHKANIYIISSITRSIILYRSVLRSTIRVSAGIVASWCLKVVSVFI
jgi:hypothetical protein